MVSDETPSENSTCPKFIDDSSCGSALKPGRVIWVNRVTFSPGHPGPSQFTNYPGLTWIGSHEKLKCLFDDVGT